MSVPGNAGYAEEADALARVYESVPFARAQTHLLPFLPPARATVLDIGAGTGRDAAGLAALGHRVTAVEPTAELRRRAVALHPDPGIEWVDDSLPDLARLPHTSSFDAILATAVWMHLDAAERARAMSRVAALLRPGGVLALTLRHGPVPPGRRMFAVTAAETVALAEAASLACLHRAEAKDGLLRADVTWDRLVFRKGAALAGGAGGAQNPPSQT
ncbi:class I SAM-dependent methyltransferase [Sabulicella glaciei]|uniref:Class I SAM-dependent methyltransferase n=1 Tax=Sabulicella glaciei TaxID=2984948 RepID=A0ABT3NVE7_9PROT|nr:class I SAM-dependent methyltransferase [Roseococcus sp. MDT2-1-1]MCW8085883.1 class I SAM-dependent methyltransferase [Roseococcus sp. MDT2-1-1]